MTLNKVDDDEKLLAVIKRHPFGIIKLYFQVITALIGAGSLLYFVLPGAFAPEDYPQLYSIIGIAGVLIVIFMVVIVLIATILYNKSELIVTDKTITQTIQVSLFSKKTSQLAMSSVEDVTAHQDGFFPTIFNYGRLLIETAGEQENFHFEYCGHADHYAKLILEARQEFMGSRELELRQAAQAHQEPALVAQAPRSRNPQGLNLGSVAADGAAGEAADGKKTVKPQ